MPLQQPVERRSVAAPGLFEQVSRFFRIGG
jgi:hypothetical protein